MVIAVSDYRRFFMGLFFGFIRSFSAIGPSCTNKEPKEKTRIFLALVCQLRYVQLLADHCRNTNCSFCYFHAFFFVRISEYENEVATFAAASFFLMLTVLTIILQRMSICNPMKRLPHGERYL